ncbi:hypothetical protein N657DRAFT_669474 [Parathielavia appendiculata]|uniref:Cytokinin riboside 5'-monophosphate phosphoribohydrolase n=1 Tax=Parathielavia appendiculata TaxID=2587402 RepID=A0AAN6U745_9PEZI|nr:hypothetical protein N657DRAFT_669474 [Parathielavia appendiculata]
MESGGASPFPESRLPTPSNGATKRTKICVYCGSSAGNKPEYVEAARALARAMAAQNIALVYGGGTVGLMGEVAKTLVSLSGPDSVHGIIPEALVRYERDPTYTSKQLNGAKGTHLAVPEESVFGRTTIVKDMHTRKRLMAQEVIEGGPGSGFIALSGGYGTLEELFETATWNQLGIHSKGICVLNINGFYDGILSWINKSVEDGFIHGENKRILVEAKSPEEAITALRDYKVSASVFKLSWNED